MSTLVDQLRKRLAGVQLDKQDDNDPDYSQRVMAANMAAQRENARLAPLHDLLLCVVEAAERDCDDESDRNEKKITVIDGVKFYPIGGDFKKNAAFYKIDRALAALAKAVGEPK